MLLIDPAGQTYDIGRGAVFFNEDVTDPDNPIPEYWDGTGPTSFQHIGNTEGEMNLTPNDEYSILTLPENTGPGEHEAYISGAGPTFNLGVFVNPIQLRRFSPAGGASAGTRYPRRTRKNTLWVAPLQLFLAEDPATGIQDEVDVAYSGGVWTKDGQPFTAEDQRLFDMSVFLWRVRTGRLTPIYRYEDGGKALQQIPVTVMHDFTKPDGHQLYTWGFDLETSGIDLDGFIS